MFSFGICVILEEINWRFGLFVVVGFVLVFVLVLFGCGGVCLGGIFFIVFLN